MPAGTSQQYTADRPLPEQLPCGQLRCIQGRCKPLQTQAHFTPPWMYLHTLVHSFRWCTLALITAGPACPTNRRQGRHRPPAQHGAWGWQLPCAAAQFALSHGAGCGARDHNSGARQRREPREELVSAESGVGWVRVSTAWCIDAQCDTVPCLGHVCLAFPYIAMAVWQRLTAFQSWTVPICMLPLSSHPLHPAYSYIVSSNEHSQFLASVHPPNPHHSVDHCAPHLMPVVHFVAGPPPPPGLPPAATPPRCPWAWPSCAAH